MKTPVNQTEFAAAVAAAEAATDAGKRITEWCGLPLTLDASGNLHLQAQLIDEREKRAEAPRRRRGVVVMQELEGFLEYTKRYLQQDTVIYVDPEEFGVMAILNGDPAGDDPSKAGWKDFRVQYDCPQSSEWEFWTEREGKQMSQVAFADVLEQRFEDLASQEGYPSPAAMLELARNLNIRTMGQFTRRINPTNGTGELVCKSEHTTDSTPIPRAFKLGLRVFEGGVAYSVEARIRFEMLNGSPVFSYVIHRRAEIERDAFGDVRNAIKKALPGVPVFAGKV